MVEQGTHKPLVVGSNPALATARKLNPVKGVDHSMFSELLAGEATTSPAFFSPFTSMLSLVPIFVRQHQ
jgi:hypothetical protein